MYTQEYIRNLTTQSLERGKAIRSSDLLINASAQAIALLCMCTGAAEVGAQADLKTLSITAAVLLFSSGVIMQTQDAATLHRGIKDAITKRTAYINFLNSNFLHETMITDIFSKFPSPDGYTEDILPISGTSADVFKQLVTARILDSSATYRQTLQPSTNIKEPFATVEHTLDTIELPRLEREIAQTIHAQAKSAFLSLPESQIIQEGNWSFDEIKYAADKIGGIIGEQLNYALHAAGIRYENAQEQTPLRRFIFQNRTRRNIEASQQQLKQRFLLPHIYIMKDVIELELEEIINQHQKKIN